MIADNSYITVFSQKLTSRAKQLFEVLQLIIDRDSQRLKAPRCRMYPWFSTFLRLSQRLTHYRCQLSGRLHRTLAPILHNKPRNTSWAPFLAVFEELGIRSISEQSPYFFLFEAEDQSRESLELEIKKLCNRIESPNELIKDDEIFVWRKYDQYIPTALQQQTLMDDYLDLGEVKDIIKKWWVIWLQINSIV